MSAKTKPQRQRVPAEVLEKRDSNSRTAHARVTLVGSGEKSKVTDNGKVPRRRNPAKKTTKKTKTANDLMLEAWKYSWENRHWRLTNPSGSCRISISTSGLLISRALFLGAFIFVNDPEYHSTQS